MTLGLRRGTVELADHDEAWRDAFAAERARLGAGLAGFGCEIEHIGSTAVATLPAKPILDIALGFPRATELPALQARLETLGYSYRGDCGNEGGHLFVRGAGDVRTHHLHAVSLEDPQWGAYLAFRDLLRRDADARAAYASVKRLLANRFAADRKSYTDGKAATVEQLLRKARAG